MASPLTPFPVSDPLIVQRASKSATTILQLQSGIAWRQYLKPAMFRGVRFYTDAAVRESARRVVTHEFPKRDTPYSEDMGRKAREFTVRAYLIVYPTGGKRGADNNPLHQSNYIPQRDDLIRALETEGPADLQLPLLGVMSCACSRYRITEEDKLGGYCTFDLTFVEYGQAPAEGTRQSAPGVFYAAQDLGSVTQSTVEQGIKDGGGDAPPPDQEIPT